MRALLILIVFGAPACGEGSSSKEDRGEFPLNIWNRSQFELLELHVGAITLDNLLEEPLGIEDRFVIKAFPSGALVIVVRRKVEVGERIAIKTASGVSVPSPGYTLIVFDTSFRLLAPENVDNPWGDTGMGDPVPVGGDGD